MLAKYKKKLYEKIFTLQEYIQALIIMTNAIPAHNHCMMCMKAIPVSETLCSEECKQKYQKMLKKKRLTVLFLWVMIIVFMAVLLFANYAN